MPWQWVDNPRFFKMFFFLLFQGLIAVQGSLSVLLEPWQWVVNHRFFEIFCFIISGSYCCTGQSLGVMRFYVMCHGSGLSIIDSFRCFILLFQGLIAVQGSL